MWALAKRQFERIVSQGKSAVELEWLDRSVSETDAYVTGSTITYGYGDETVTWTTGSLYALVTEVDDELIVVEPGFYVRDYKQIYVDPDSTIAARDQCIYPSGSGIRYIVQTVTNYELNGVDVSKWAQIRRFIPRSGSNY